MDSTDTGSDTDTSSELDLDECILDLDTSWINEFDAIDNDYKSYYSEPLEFINMNCIYLNAANEIINVHEEKVIFINKGLLSREEIVGLIKRNSIIDIDRKKEKADKYSLMSILVFNINIEPENLKTFFKNNKTNDKSDNNSDTCIGSQFLNSIKTIDTIVFDKSISMFHDINNLYLVFAKKSELKKRAATKRRALSSFAKTKRRQEKTI
jgi:hypothetical protein